MPTLLKLSTHEMIEMTTFQLITLQAINISHLGKKKIILKTTFKREYALVGWPSFTPASNLYPWRLPLDPEPKDMTFRGKQRNDSDVMES